jgi:hypothetical protein
MSKTVDSKCVTLAGYNWSKDLFLEEAVEIDSVFFLRHSKNHFCVDLLFR